MYKRQILYVPVFCTSEYDGFKDPSECGQAESKMGRLEISDGVSVNESALLKPERRLARTRRAL